MITSGRKSECRKADGLAKLQCKAPFLRAMGTFPFRLFLLY